MNPQSNPILQQLKPCLGPLDTWNEVTSWDGLMTLAEERRPTVVIFSDAENLFYEKLTQLVGLNPLVRGVAVGQPETFFSQPQPELFYDVLVPPFTPEEATSRLATAAKLVSVQAQLETSSQIDSLTGLYHRDYFVKRLAEELALALRHESPLSCVILGIQYFKILTDSYGNTFINHYLQYVANLLQKKARQEDVVARLGDSEFALLLPRTQESGALVMIQRLLADLKTKPFIENGVEEQVILQAGIVGVPSSSVDFLVQADDLVRYGRHALHQAGLRKNNPVQCFSEIRPNL